MSPIALPDSDFDLEPLVGSDWSDRILFSSEVFILKCLTGRALISINSTLHEFATGSNFLLAEGMIFKVIDCSDDFEGVMLRFSCNFFNEIYPFLDPKAIEVMNHSAPDLYQEEEMRMTNLIFDQLCLLYHRPKHTYRHQMARNLMLNYLFETCEQTYKYVKDYVVKAADSRTFLIDRFYQLCVEHHQRHRNLDFYADKLNITPRYLHKICKETLQITPKQCVDYIVSGSAKKYLLTTTLTNQQISHELNFPDQTTFGQFFKRNVGMTPSEFRSKYK